MHSVTAARTLSPVSPGPAAVLAGMLAGSGLASRFTPAEFDTLHAGAARLYRAGKYPEAANLLALLRLCRPTDARFAESAGYVARKQNDLAAAIRAFHAAWHLAPENFGAASQLAECLLLAGRRADAMEVLERLRDAARASGDATVAQRAAGKLEMLKGFA